MSLSKKPSPSLSVSRVELLPPLGIITEASSTLEFDQLVTGANPYDINVLQGMRWAKAVWNTPDETIFANCW
jgi:hypothetical protein